MENNLVYFRFIIEFMDYEDLEDPLSRKRIKESGLVVASSYSEAVYKVCDYYGEINVVSILVSGEIECDVATDEELLEIITSKESC